MMRENDKKYSTTTKSTLQRMHVQKIANEWTLLEEMADEETNT